MRPPLVVLVHGSMDRSAGLLRLSRRLDDTSSCCATTAGATGARRVGGPFRVGQHVDDLARCSMTGAGRRAALVFGHSFGGNVALGLAARRPDLVAAVAVYETPLSWLDWWPATRLGGSALAEADPRPRPRRSCGACRATEVGTAASVEPGRPPSPRVRRWSVSSPTCAAARRGGRSAIDVPFSPCGRAGPRAPPQAASAPGRMLADCSVEIVPGAGHVGPNTHADEVTRRLRRFVGDRLSRKQASDPVAASPDSAAVPAMPWMP